MKFSFYCTGVAATALMTLVASSICIAKPSPLGTQVGPIDVRKIDPNVFKNPKIPQGGLSLTPSVSGKIKFLKGQYGSVPVCKDVEVYLISKEYTEEPAPPAPKPEPGGITIPGDGKIQKPIFVYKGKISPDPKGKSDSNATYCNYSVPAEKKVVGKKAWVIFRTNLFECFPNADTSVIIPDKPIEKSYQQSFCGIG